MKHFKLTLLATALGLGVAAAPVMANEWAGTLYPSGYHASYNSLLTREQITSLRQYMQYEEREPCQNYKLPPVGFYRTGCDLKYIYPNAPTPETYVQVPGQTVLATYRFMFNFDRADLGENSIEVLNKIATEIKRYNPREVVVSGFADRSGQASYNIALSQRRADAVSNALNNRGIANRTLATQAYGETNLAVDTKDGVRLPDNRRVIVEFLR